MSKEVRVRISHDLGAVEAQRRITTGLERLRDGFGDKLTSSDVVWKGPHADVHVGAFGQSVNGTLDIESDSVLVTVRLPWLLAAMSGRVGTFLQSSGRDLLQIAPVPRKP